MVLQNFVFNKFPKSYKKLYKQEEYIKIIFYRAGVHHIGP